MTSYESIDILLVEDSDTDAELTTRALRRGHIMNQVFRVRDGVEAVEFVFREGAFAGRGGDLPKLILLDLNMPRIGGIEVLQRLKANERTSRIPIVVLTSSAQSQDIVESYNLGVQGYLVKPVSLPAFTDMVVQVGLYWTVTNKVPAKRT